MHIHFLAIGGAGIAPLAQIAAKAGYDVSGSDKQLSSNIDYLKAHGIDNIYIGQSVEELDKINKQKPIDWLVYSSAVTLENPSPAELEYCKQSGIKFTKRDEFISQFIADNKLKMLAVAGTHGKTTTTAMLVWLFKQYDLGVNYLLPAKVSYGEMGEYDSSSEYFIYEADEFDNNFLAYKPHISLITGVSWDHHEIFPTRDAYKQAFRQFISQSAETYIWQADYEYLEPLEPRPKVIDEDNPLTQQIKLKGLYNRRDAVLAVSSFIKLTSSPVEEVLEKLASFPGLNRRMEEITTGLYSDYAHTPEKIKGAMSVALEMAGENEQSVVVIYEPLTNRRQIHMQAEYKDCFEGAIKVYWLPSYLAREDPKDQIISPEELISQLDRPEIAEAANMDDRLKQKIDEHLNNGDLVIGMAGGGGGSLDDWLRKNYPS